MGGCFIWRIYGIRNPATDEVVGKYALGTQEDTLKAISVAKDAFDNGPWNRMSGDGKSSNKEPILRLLSLTSLKIHKLFTLK